MFTPRLRVRVSQTKTILTEFADILREDFRKQNLANVHGGLDRRLNFQTKNAPQETIEGNISSTNGIFHLRVSC